MALHVRHTLNLSIFVLLDSLSKTKAPQDLSYKVTPDAIGRRGVPAKSSSLNESSCVHS